MYDGTIKDGGRYRFSTHDGDLRVSIPEKSSVSVSVSTFDGDFSACFPVQLVGPKTKHRFTLTIGSGSARLELESFNGDIRLCRPGQLAKDKDWRAKNKDWGKDKEHENDQEEECPCAGPRSGRSSSRPPWRSRAPRRPRVSSTGRASSPRARRSRSRA